LRGKTVRQAEEEIRKAYDAEYLVNPQVNVFVIEYWKRFVKVFGAVNSPGVVVFPPEEGLTLLGAISRAGGFSRLADTKKVILSRTAPDGKTETSTVNAEDLLKRGTGADVALLPDDIINVGERIL
jgi:polysaccharide export outer membrane protein